MIEHENIVYAIDSGEQLYQIVFETFPAFEQSQEYQPAIQTYKDIKTKIIDSEKIQSILENDTFHVFVPFVVSMFAFASVYEDIIRPQVLTRLTYDVPIIDSRY